MADTQHEITIGPSPLAAARVQAALIHGDIESGQAQMPGEHVRYEDKPGKDQSLSPVQLNAEGKGNCASIPRAIAPYADASHVGVVPVPQTDGGVVNHTFLIADAKPGDAPIQIGPDGRAVSPIPPNRILDPNVAAGMNGGQPLPPAIYQGAALAPIAPPGVPDLSHVHADPADRAAEGKAHQGVPRLHTPTTDAGVHVAVASHLAARAVDPHPAAEARPVAELYPDHPAEAAADRAVVGAPRTTGKMVAQLAAGLRAVKAGKNPAPLPGDPPIEPHHQAAAAKILDHIETLAIYAAPPGTPEAPPAAKAAASAKIAADADRLKTANRSDPEHDHHATVVAEVEAMLPGTTPPAVVEAIARPDDAPSAAPAVARDVFDVDDDGLDFFSFSDRDRGGGINLPLSVALSVGAGLCHKHLIAWRVGCPGDGNRCERPARRRLDPRMGSVGDAIEAILTGGFSEVPRELDARAPRYAGEWRAHNDLVERRRREYGELASRGRGGFAGEQREFAAPRREFGASRSAMSSTWDPGHFAGAPGSKHWDPGHFGADHRMGAYSYVPTAAQMAANRASHARQVIVPGGGGWYGRDRYLVGNQSQRLLLAVRAYESNPIVRARLDAGGTIYGIGLPQVLAATGVPRVVTDLSLAGGFHGGGGGHGGGMHGGMGMGSGAATGSSFGATYMGDDGGIAVEDPSWFDPQMSGPGSSPATMPPTTPTAAAPAPAPAPAMRPSASATIPTDSRALATREERPIGERREERRPLEERGIERRDVERFAPRVTERHWSDRWGRDRVGPIVAAEWRADQERRHWRDRWGRVRFEPIVVADFAEEIDAPAAEVETVAVPWRPREPWYRRWFHWGPRREFDVRMGGIDDDRDDDLPMRTSQRAIRCAC